MKTHQQALDIAGDYDNLSDKIQAYIKARGMVLVPREATFDMVYEGGSDEVQFPGRVWDAMLAAAPNPFEGEE